MQLTKLLYSALLSFTTTTAAASKAPTTGTGTTVTLAIPASPHLPNPLHQLSGHRTHATLSRLGAAYEAPLSGPLPPPSSSPNTNNAAFLVFHNVTPGSYIADVHSASHGFAPLRVDVVVGADETAPKVRVWETFRGNEWENKGEEVRGLATGAGAGAAAAFPVRVLGAKAYFVERGSFSVFGILKNPMILMSLVSLGLFVGMPKLMENMDPETRAEFEKSQQNNPMSSLLGGGGGGSSSGAGNLDVAGFLSGHSKGSAESAGGGGNDNARKGGRR